jgi:hypothetical protein
VLVATFILAEIFIKMVYYLLAGAEHLGHKVLLGRKDRKVLPGHKDQPAHKVQLG